MPQPRPPLQPDSGNRRRGTQLTPYLRGKIIQAFDNGTSRAQISRDFDLPWSTVNEQIQTRDSRPNGVIPPRTGRPPILNAHIKRRLLRFINLNPFASYTRIRRELFIAASDDTIRRALQAYGIRKWIAKKRPLITEKIAKRRLHWAKAHLNWTLDQWSKIMFSDECSVERGAGKRRG